MTDARLKRIAEIIPGALIWTTLILAVVLSFIAPLAVMYFIIIFDLLWLFRVVHFIIFLTTSWHKYRRDAAVDWNAVVSADPRAAGIYHLIFLPTYKEDLDILRATFKSLAASAYPMKDKAIIVLAGEERDRERFLANAATLEAEFAGAFFKTLVTLHPKDLPGEIPGKGSNINWAGHRAQELIDGLGIPHEKVIVSSFDVDTCPHPQYFAYLTHKYVTHPNPTRSSFQPLALYNNNMWDSPALIRVVAFGTTFWLMSELAKPERLCTFSSHSMSFKALVDVGFWEKDIVTEDSRIFLQCLLRYDGEYEVTPLHLPVSMDTVMSGSYAKSLVALYKQQRRWAWGVEHFPYLVRRFREKPNMPLRKKVSYLWTLSEGMYSWATAPLLIFALGRLPFLVASPALRGSTIFSNTPHTLELIMQLAMGGVFVSAFLGFWLLPHRPVGRRWTAYLAILLQWLFVPITSIVFGAIPAIDAQTRLMLGKYMGFNVTEKKRKEREAAVVVVGTVPASAAEAA